MSDEKTAKSNFQNSKEKEFSWFRKNIYIFFLSIILGILCGMIMVLFNYLLIVFEIGFSYLPYFVSPLLAGVLTSVLVKFGKFERILGTGSDKFIEEVSKIEEKYKRIPNLVAKACATSWTYGSGMICGREGPGLLIGANLGYFFSKEDNPDREIYSFIGASACTAALLKAPISGALFCAELPYNNYIHYKSLIPSIMASTIAYITFCLFFGFTSFIDTNLISISPLEINYLSLIPLLVLFGIVSGLFVLIFVILLRKFINLLRKWSREKIGLWILPLLGGLGYGIFLLLTIPYLFEDYYDDLTHPDITLLGYLIANIPTLTWIILLIFLFIIIVSTFLSIGTLQSAGIIMPLMIIGALFGGFFGIILYPENPELFVLLGISAVLGAGTKNPIAAIFIIVEMTWVPLLFIPAGITTIVAFIFSSKNSIIPGQMEKEV